MITSNSERLQQIQKRGGLRRMANFARSSIDAETRTVELAFSSETDSVQRWFGTEILGHAPGEVDLSRLNAGAPLLWMHNQKDQRGIIQQAWIDPDGVGRAVVRFGRSAEASQLFQDVQDGIITKVSVGYTAHAMTLVEERDGMEVYRITSWQPYEISMVSVPADDTVGVGRALEIPQEGLRGKDGYSRFQTANRGISNTVHPIKELLDGARNAMGGFAFFDGAGNFSGSYKKRAAHVVNHSIRALEVQSFVSQSLRDVHLPAGTAAGAKSTIEQSVAAGSRCVQAGSRLITVSAASKAASAGNGVLAFERAEHRFDIIDPAPFLEVPDGGELDDSALPVHRAKADVESMPMYGVRIPLSRTEQKSYRDGELANTALASIAAGLARLVDRVLLAAIMAAEPDYLNLGLVAAAGVKMGELRGLVGTNGDHCTPGVDGKLRVSWGGYNFGGGAGIDAEFTPDTTRTIVGAFDRAAIAIFEDITLIADRINVNGDLTLTCWASMQPLLPKAGFFWKSPEAGDV